jgi:hypothetical protein
VGERGRPTGTARPPRFATTPTDEDRDPALGERVPRCAVCGMPTTEFVIGRWTGDAQLYRVRVCDHCIGRDRQPNPDPLTISMDLQ